MRHLMDGRLFNGVDCTLKMHAWLLAAVCTAALSCGGAEQNGNSESDSPTAGGQSNLGGAKAVGGQSSSSSAGGASSSGATSTSGQPSGGTSGSATGENSGGTGNVPTGGKGSGGQSSGGRSTAMATGGGAGVTANGGTFTTGQAGAQATGGVSTTGTSSSPTCGAMSQTNSSRAARSAGFAGSYQDDYYPLYDTACNDDTNCQAACVTAGGTTTSCASSECIDSTPDYCLPPTFWFDLTRLRVESSTMEDSAWIIMVNNPYRDQLIASDFQFEIPANATITGITFSVNRSADGPNTIADYEVKVMRGTSTLGLDRAMTTPWTNTFQYANYGGANDLWGATWTPSEINASTFGVALTPMYLDTAGNARAYVDFVRATVSYTVPCT